MTITMNPTTTLVIPVGLQAARCEVPTEDRVLWARYLVATLAAKRAGHGGVLTIHHAEAYLRSIIEPRIARLAAAGAVRAALVAEMEGKIAAWTKSQSSVGPALGTICAGMFRGDLVDEGGRHVGEIEREPEAADLFVALLGHDPDAGHPACAACDALTRGDWSAAFAATRMSPAVVIDAYRLAVDAGWLPALPEASARRPPVVRSRMLTYEPLGGYGDEDL